MESITKEQLIKKGLRHMTYKGETYFPIKEILDNYPDARLNQGINAEARDFGNDFSLSVRAEDFVVMTEFDKKILKTLNFNPKNK